MSKTSDFDPGGALVEAVSFATSRLAERAFLLVKARRLQGIRTASHRPLHKWKDNFGSILDQYGDELELDRYVLRLALAAVIFAKLQPSRSRAAILRDVVSAFNEAAGKRKLSDEATAQLAQKLKDALKIRYAGAGARRAIKRPRRRVLNAR